jgi:hypothetical protein
MRTLTKILIAVLLAAPVSFAQGQTAFSLEDWTKLDSAHKAALVRGFIANAKEDKITLHRSPLYYVMQIDTLIDNSIKNQDAAAIKQSLGVTIKTIAMMDCDWDSGKDRLQEARAFLGDALFEAYKENYPDKYQMLANGCRR